MNTPGGIGQRSLLLSGIAAPLLYAAADTLAGLRWAAYSFRDMTISELGAIGAPSRPLFAAILVPSYLLLAGFGAGVRRAAAGRARLRVAGSLVIAFAVLALTVGQVVPMQPRGVEQGLAGALHLVEGLVAMLLVLSAMVLAAAALGPRFRRYTAVTIAIVLVFGAWSGADAPRIGAGLPTPWVGVRERVFWYAYQLWFIVLALTLLREDRGPAQDRCA